MDKFSNFNKAQDQTGRVDARSYGMDRVDDYPGLRALMQRGNDTQWEIYISFKRLRNALWASFPPMVFVRWLGPRVFAPISKVRSDRG